MTTSNNPSEEPVSEFDTRENLLDADQCERLSSERGKEEVGKVRCDQSGQPGPQAESDPVQRADQEGGDRGRLLLEKAREKREQGEERPVEPEKWTKYDWL